MLCIYFCKDSMSRRSSEAIPESVKSFAKKTDKKGTRLSVTSEPATTVSETSMETTGVIEPTHPHDPLLQAVESLPDGTILINGNMTLISLNLAGNQIGEPGAESLLYALKAQTTLLQSTVSTAGPSLGLLRLCIQRNNLPVDSGTLILINAVMSTRDPLQKPLSTADHDST